MKKLLGEAEACTGCNYLFIITTMLKILRPSVAIMLIVEVIDVITSIWSRWRLGRCSCMRNIRGRRITRVRCLISSGWSFNGYKLYCEEWMQLEERNLTKPQNFQPRRSWNPWTSMVKTDPAPPEWTIKTSSLRVSLFLNDAGESRVTPP